MSKSVTGILIFALIFTGTILHAFDVVREGKAKSYILLSENASKGEKFAAEEFAKYVKKMTGADIVISGKKISGLAPVRFRMADSSDIKNDPAYGKLNKLGNIGYIISANKNALTIIARTTQGIHHGNYFLLKKYGEIYFLHPDEPEIVPEKSSFIIPNQVKVRNPYFTDIRPAGNAPYCVPAHRVLWRMRNGSTVTTRPAKQRKGRKDLIDLEEKLGHAFSAGGHCFTPLLVGSWSVNEIKKLYAKHPEYFGMRNGKRVWSDLSLSNREQLCQPCLSNPEVLKRIAANLQKELIKTYGGQPITYRIYNDDHTFWCECAECKKLDDPKAGKLGKNSNRYWTLVNYLAKELLPKNPQLTLLAIAYQDYRDVPTKVKPDPRVPIQIAPHGDCYNHTLDDPGCPTNPRYRKMFEDWKKTGAKLYVFEYHNQLPGECRYIPIERKWVEFLRYYHRTNVLSANAVICDGESPHTNQPYYSTYNYKNSWYARWQQAYMTGHFAWDLYDDYEKVWEKINSLYYGNAWKYIRPYRLLLEKALKETGICFGYGTSAVSSIGKCYEYPGLAKTASDLLKKACDSVKNNPLYLKRVLREKEYFEKNWASAGYSSIKNSGDIIKVNRADSPIVIDGKFDEKAYLTATEFPELFVNTNRGTRFTPDAKTKAKILFDAKNLYLAIECGKFEGKVNDSAKANGLKALSGSHIELLLMSEHLNGKYYHIGISRNGFTYSALTTDKSTRDLNKKLDFEYKIKDTPEKYFIEIRIPTHLLGGIREGDCWKINFMRSSVGKNGKMQKGFTSKDTQFHDTPNAPVFTFGEGGELLLNGDFKTQVKAVSPKPPRKHPDRIWQFQSEKMPAHWTFAGSNPGIASLVKNPDGSYFLNFSSGKSKYPMLWQYLRNTGSEITEYYLSFKARGKGTLAMCIYYNSNRKSLPPKTFKLTKEWKNYSCTVDISKAIGRKSLFMKLSNGSCDISSIKLVPVVLADNPDALKH